MATPLIVHGHFYQPPRENPWTGVLEREPSARPFHDWNERIHQECYRANAFARVLDRYGHPQRIVNNYAHISFNFGPTLLSWLQQHDPVAYGRILEADRLSALFHNGHGNAIAQAYNHSILPLCNERDRRTQIRWGLADFVHRFGRQPASMWLPETACNDDTLGALIDEGLKYVILSPHQAERVRPLSGGEWQSVADGTIDPGVPYCYVHRDGSGRTIALFFYDGPSSRAIAFEGLLCSSAALFDRFEGARRGGTQLVHVATDGETYGHHSGHGERCLAYAVSVDAKARGFRMTNYGEYLEQCPPTMEVEVKAGSNGEGTAWSCEHGVDRWYRDCGCQGGGLEGWNQAWRTPLRQALDLLRDEAARHFEQTAGDLFLNPWDVRDRYIELVLDKNRSRDEWLRRHAHRPLSEQERVRALTFLEMQRNALFMYTSCGWFFSDISGIETVQVMKYAGHLLDLMEEFELPSPRQRFLEVLGEARSNIAEMGTGADVFRRFVDPLGVSAERVGAHIALGSLAARSEERGQVAGYRFERTRFQSRHHGRLTMATARLKLEELATGKLHDFGMASLHFGGVDFYCVLRGFAGAQPFVKAAARLWNHFPSASLPALLRVAQEEFGPDEFGLECLLDEGRRSVSEIVFGNLVQHFVDEYGHLYDTHQRALGMLQDAGFELPRELLAAAEFTIGRQFQAEIERAHGSRDPEAYRKAIELAEEVARRGYVIDRAAASETLAALITTAVRDAVHEPSSARYAIAASVVALAGRLRLEPNLDQAQELVFFKFEDVHPWPEELHPLAAALGLSAALFPPPP